MIGLCPLGSGSKGNSLFLGTTESKILIDAGLSGKAIQKRLEQLEVSLEEIDAILITHEHGDHITGLKVLAKRHGIPIIANAATAKAIEQTLKLSAKFKVFTTGESFFFRDLKIHPFSIQHDAEDPVAFTIEVASLKIGVCTDLGFASTLVKRHLQYCHYLYLEANHDPAMVYACPRPMNYKQRVLSRTGHLSNDACAELLCDIGHKELSHIYLAHLSSECNSEEKALSTVRKKLKEIDLNTSVSIAKQDEVSIPILFSELTKASSLVS